jgi:hypothetical protein
MSLVERGIRLALRNGWERGLVEGNDAWLVVGGLALLVYLGRRAMHREVETLLTQKLFPGVGLTVSAESEP